MKKTVSRYYDENYQDYADGWSADHLHYGFWYEDTSSHEESLVNPVREIIRYLDIGPDDMVLDAGCGSGGACRYIAERCRSVTTGIALSDVLIESAKKISLNTSGKELLSFYYMDYTSTAFEDETFTKIYGIESVCHTEKKEDFLKEACRILKKGGRLAVVDSFLNRNDLNEDEEKKYREMLEGWAIPNLNSEKQFGTALEQAGFHTISFHDKTVYVEKSCTKIFEAARERMAGLFLMSQSGRVPESRLKHNISLYRQKECLDLGIWHYGIFVAHK